MCCLETALASVLGLIPNRKFVASLSVARDARLIGDEGSEAYCRAHVRFISSYYLRFFALLSRRYRARALSRVEVHGERHLLEAEAGEVGAILVSAHLGDFDAAGAWLAQARGITPVVVARALKPRWRDALFRSVRRHCGVSMRSAHATTLVALAADLQAGRWVLSMVDRRTPGPTVPGSLLGRDAALSVPMAILALRTGAPLVPAVSWRNYDGGMTVWFGKPATVHERSGVFQALSNALAQVEKHIRDHPEQWHVPADREQLAWVGDELDATRRVTRVRSERWSSTTNHEPRSASAASVSLPARGMSR